MKTANPTTIEITDLVKDIKGKRIIDHVTLHLESGKITGLKGVNGSGKTMLMRLVCGLITPSSGASSSMASVWGRTSPSRRAWASSLRTPPFWTPIPGLKT